MYRNYIQKMEKLGKFSNSTLFAKNQLIKRKDKKWNVITPDFIKNEPGKIIIKIENKSAKLYYYIRIIF